MPHTPGPWKWYGDELLSNDGKLILAADNLDQYDPQVGLLMDNKDGDKPLIESAPELLYSLERLTTVLGGTINNWMGLRAAYENALATIAKARGVATHAD